MVASILINQGFDGQVLAEETLELFGERDSDGLWEQDGVGDPGAQGSE
jgi:hypothetical protein